MKSVRLDPETETDLEVAAKARGITESEFIRRAIRREAQAVLGETLDLRLADVLGKVTSKGGRANDSHAKFQKLVTREHKKRPR